MKALPLALAAALIAAPLAACAPMAPSPAPTLQAADPGVLFWSAERRERDLRRMEQVMPHAPVSRGDGPVRALPAGAPLDLDPSAYMAAERVAGVLVIQDGEVRLERYGLGLRPQDHWASFSMTKSLTSTLVGAALKSGAIRSLDDALTDYLPALAGGGYDGVTVRQLLTMTSGVAWNEDYEDPNSDVARFLYEPAAPGEDAVVAYMSRLPRAAAPGTRWSYSTGETNLVGSLLVAAVGKPLARQLSETIWARAGMEHDAVWALDQQGREMGGCCVSASLRDWGRVGLMALEGGRLGDARIVADDWFAQAGRKQADIGAPGQGYGYQWWTMDDGQFGARGIFGQSIQIDPARRLVIVLLSAWPDAVGADHSRARNAFYDQVRAAVDAGS